MRTKKIKKTQKVITYENCNRIRMIDIEVGIIKVAQYRAKSLSSLRNH